MKADNADLSALTVSVGALIPAFDPAVSEYAVDVENDENVITVTGTPKNAKATVSESGVAERTLAVGHTTIAITVTAEDGTTVKAYTVKVFRKPVVYTAGSYKNGTNDVPCYWKNAAKTDLLIPESATSGVATEIVLAGDSIYVSGSYYPSAGGNNVPCYWKDGVRTDLDSSSSDGFAMGITVVDDSVYVAGHYFPSGNAGYRAACYWKDGTRYYLDHESDKPSNATAIAVKGTTVITVGSHGIGRDPCYWEGSVLNELAMGMETSGCVEDVITNGESFYMAGSAFTPYYYGYWWKDGVPNQVSVSGADRTVLSGIAVEEDTVYLCGFYESGSGVKLCYWKGDERVDLTDIYMSHCVEVPGIEIFEGRVYASGTTYLVEDPIAQYWDNAASVELEGFGTKCNDITLGL